MDNDKKTGKDIEDSKVGWSNAVVMVCTKCGKQFSEQADLEAPERIKSELKSKLKSEYGKSVRVITTSCLDICPVDKIAIAVASNSDKEVFKAYVVDPKVSADELVNSIFKK